jgi:uncharacterized membrane protein
VSSPGPPAPRLRTARRLTLAGALLLGACVTVAAMQSVPWPRNLGWTAALLLPLLLPVPGLWRGNRRTCAWATLCIAPYIVYGITEVIANPGVRVAAGAILFAGLAWFVSLVYCLRVSRPAPGDSGGAQGTSAG